MNKFLYILAFVLLGSTAYGQTTTNNQAWYYFKFKLSADSLYANKSFYLPIRDTSFTPAQVGAMTYRSTDNTIYACISLTGRKWQAVGSSVDTFTIATRDMAKHFVDSAKATVTTLYTGNGTLSSNRRVTMGGFGLGFYSSSTIYDTLNSTEATFLRGKGKIHAEDGWVMNQVESAGSNHWGRFQAYRATSTDSAILVTLQSRNNILYNWKNAKFEADWNQWAKMSVNVNWKINNLDTSQKGISVIHGSGLGAGTVKIDREVLPSGSGETVVWDPTTQTLARGAGGSTVTETPYTVTYSATPTFDYDNGVNQEITLTGNITGVTFSDIPDGKTMYILLKQDATGSRTLSGLPAGSKVINSGGGAVTLSTAGSAWDLIGVKRWGSSYLITYGKDFN